MLERVKLISQIIYVRLTKYQLIDVFMIYISESLTPVGENFLIQIRWNILQFVKNWILQYRVMTSVTKRIRLTDLLINVMLRY